MANVSIDRELRRAKVCELKGSLDEARSIYRSVLAKDPGNARARMALSALEGGAPDRSAAPGEDRVKQLVALCRQGSFSDVVEQASKLVAQSPSSFQLWNLLGIAHNGLGRLDEAERAFRKAAELKPDLADPLVNLGSLLRSRGKLDEAIESYRQALRIKPGLPAVHYNLGNALKDQGRDEEAAASYRQALRLKPDYAEAHYNLGNLVKDKGKPAEAAQSYRQALHIRPDFLEAHYNLGIVLKDQGELEAAAASYQRALKLRPDYAPACLNLGTIFEEQEKLEDAAECFERALSIDPDFADARFGLGNVHKGLGQLDKAAECFRQVAQIKPEFADAHNNLGIVLMEQGRLDEAIASYRRALGIESDRADFHNNLGLAYLEIDQLDDGIACFRRALSITPEDGQAHFNLANALKEQGKLDEAVESYQRGLLFKPDYPPGYAEKLHRQAIMCDWSGWDEFERLKHWIGIEEDAVAPFTMLAFEDDPERQAIRARRYAEKTFKQEELALPARTRRHSGKIRIGYFSADFRNHPMLYLMAGLFREHDKSRFEIYAYSYGPRQRSDILDRVLEDIDHFIDIRDMPDEAVVKLAREHEIDIAIDRKGYTQYSRSRLFAYRLAPVQINYLAYPGTMGADFIDYIVADPVIIPEQEREHYSEKVIYLPHSYQPNNDRREIAQTQTSRTDFGLPEDGFVFCCFNNSYKMGPREFNIWMRLLGKVEGSALWLLRSNKWVEENLRREAEAIGIEPGRLVFADKMPHAEHLARHRHADLFIDTFNYNAHTTTSDALWAGLPVVTKAGRQFAARVAASLLTAIGLPELITESDEDYEALILELATNPDRLAAIKAKLAENRLTQPLFDTVRYTRDFENALVAAYEEKMRTNR